MKFLVITLMLSVSLSSFAHDSEWSLCKASTTLYEANETLILSTYEHREGQGRQTDLTLIFGGNVLSGSFNNTERSSGKVKLASKFSSFVGTVKFNGTGSVDLKGSLGPVGGKTKVAANFKCEILRD